MRPPHAQPTSIVLPLLLVGGFLAVGMTPAAAEGDTATKISSGGFSSCAVTATKRLKCWGSNTYGQLGLGDDLTNRHTPVRVPGLRGVVQVSVGPSTTCAVLRDGSALCWGLNSNGQVGDGSTEDRRVPTQVKRLTSRVTSVSVGATHSCALRVSGAVLCWGDNRYGQVGDGTSGNEYHRPVRLERIGAASQVSAGSFYSCATVNGRAKCWGSNRYGKLGDRTTTDRSIPTQVATLDSDVRRVVAGYFTTCALLTGGALTCWGDNGYGQVGVGTSGNEYHRPVPVLRMARGVTSFDTYYDTTCAAKDGSAKCWGFNADYQLGDGTTDDALAPRQVSGLTSRVKRVDVSYATGCALLRNGVERCWARNVEGQVGAGSDVDFIPTPLRVAL